jgi:mTERF domain-containing protein
MGANDKQIAKIIRKNPQVLHRTPESLEKRIKFLESIGVKEGLGKIIAKAPQIICLRTENMQMTVKFLQSTGISDEDITRIVYMHPEILTYNVNRNLKPTYEFLRENFNISKERLVKSPNLLSYGLESRIKPRYWFLKSKGLENTYKVTTALMLTDDKFCNMVKCSLKDYSDFKRRYKN